MAAAAKRIKIRERDASLLSQVSRDNLRSTLLDLDRDKDVWSACQVSKRIFDLCRDNTILWKRYKDHVKKSWQNKYLLRLFDSTIFQDQWRIIIQKNLALTTFGNKNVARFDLVVGQNILKVMLHIRPLSPREEQKGQHSFIQQVFIHSPSWRFDIDYSEHGGLKSHYTISQNKKTVYYSFSRMNDDMIGLLQGESKENLENVPIDMRLDEFSESEDDF